MDSVNTVFNLLVQYVCQTAKMFLKYSLEIEPHSKKQRERTYGQS